MTVHCACGDPKCDTYIRSSGRELWVEDNVKDREILMYMDPNSIVALIKELRASLKEIADGED